jgi:hypothetical protein
MTIIDPHQFLMNLFRQGIPDDTTLILEYEGREGRLHILRCDTVDEASEAASRLIQEGHSVYINPGLRIIDGLTSSQSRGGDEEIGILTSIWGDVDFKAAGHKEEEALLPEDQVRALLERIPAKAKPSILIHSGGGFYPGWLLREPFDLMDEDGDQIEDQLKEAKQVRDVIRSWFKDQLDLIFQNYSPSARLRLPGSRNFKRSAEGEEVRIIEYTGQRYTHAELLNAFRQTRGDKMVATCEFFQDCKANPNEVVYDSWFAMASNLACVEDGEAKFFALSQLSENYEHKTAKKQWKAVTKDEKRRPHRCENIRLSDGNTCPKMSIEGRCTLPGGGHSPAALANDANFNILEEMNAEFAVLTAGNVGILQEYYDYAQKRWTFTLLSDRDFNLLMANKPDYDTGSKGQRGNPNTISRGHYWRTHPHRREYKGIVFDPSGSMPDAYYNLWRGFAVEPDSNGSCEKYLAHLQDIVCDGDEKAFDYLIKWMAHAVQRTAELPGVAVVLMSQEKGTGKNTAIEYFGDIFGHHFLSLRQQQQLLGRFNAHLRDAIVVHGEELVWGGDKNAESALKGLITNPQQAVEAKYKDVMTIDSFIRLMMSSNSDWVVPATEDERRFFVLEVSSKRVGDHAYFMELQHERRNGGVAALLAYLQSLDLESFNVRAVPTTAALARQKKRSSPLAEFMYERLCEGTLRTCDDVFYQRVPFNGLYNRYGKWLKDTKRSSSPGTKTDFAEKLEEMFPGTVKNKPGKQPGQSSRVEYLCFPSWDEMADQFQERYGLRPTATEEVESVDEYAHEVEVSWC